MKKRLVASLSPRWSGFDPSQSNCNWTQWHRDTLFPSTSIYPFAVSFHHCSILIVMLILLLSEGQTGDDWKSSNKAMFLGILGRTGQRDTSHYSVYALYSARFKNLYSGMSTERKERGGGGGVRPTPNFRPPRANSMVYVTLLNTEIKLNAEILRLLGQNKALLQSTQIPRERPLTVEDR
jgi:hypothetical protein